MRAWFLIPALLASATAHAANLTVTVRGTDGRPVANAVVAAHLVDRPTPMPSGGRDFAVQQKDLQFSPFVLVVPANSDVSFPNLDKVRHHVYSFSPAKTFELKLYAGVPREPVVFDKPGVVVLGCNIHDKMVAYVRVVDTPYFAKTDESGAATVDAPAGKYILKAWHPDMTAGQALEQPLAVKSDGANSAAFRMSLKPPVRDADSFSTY